MDLTELKRIRRVQKITIGVLSKKTGIHRDRISLIERGLVNPSFGTVVKIAESINAKIIIKYSNENTI